MGSSCRHAYSTCSGSGLRTLTVIQDTVKFVEQSTGKKIDADRLDFDDENVYAFLGTSS